MRESAKSRQLADLSRKMRPILRKNDVVRAGIFGSYARGEAKKSSDIDVLIEFKGRKSLLDLAGVKVELEERLHKKVDIVEYTTVHPRLRDRIKMEEVRLI